MPQREFWTKQHPCEVLWRYQVDLARPEDVPTLYVAIRDQSGHAMAAAGGRVPHNVLHEAVASALVESWETYLFGEPQQLEDTFSSCMKRWRSEASKRPLWS